MSSACYVSRRLKIYLSVIAGVSVIFILFYGYSKVKTYNFKATTFVMDTLVSIEIEGPRGGEDIINNGMKIFQNLQDKFDVNLDTSEVSKINASSGLGPVEVSDDTLDVIKSSIEFSEISDGAFDITIGVITKEWGFTVGKYRLPEDKVIRELLKLVDYKNIDISDSKVELKKRGMYLDLGGIAKGYAVDKVYDFLKSKNIKEAIIDAGGTIRTIGTGKVWKIGIKDPDGRRDVIGILSLESGLAVATSGDYERYFVENGVRYHHLLDPRTGYPANLCRSVTVVSDSAAESDALSTAIFVLGPEKGLELAERLGLGTVIVDKYGDIIVSDNLSKEFVRYGD